MITYKVDLFNLEIKFFDKENFQKLYFKIYKYIYYNNIINLTSMKLK